MVRHICYSWLLGCCTGTSVLCCSTPPQYAGADGCFATGVRLAAAVSLQARTLDLVLVDSGTQVAGAGWVEAEANKTVRVVDLVAIWAVRRCGPVCCFTISVVALHACAA